MRRYGAGVKPSAQRWEINYASPLARMPLFVFGLSEDVGRDFGKPASKGLKYNGPLTVVLPAGTATFRLTGNGHGSTRFVRQSSFWGFSDATPATSGFRLPTQAADVIPAQGLTYAFIRQPATATITRSHNFGHNAGAGVGRRAGGHVPLSDGTVYWDYGGATAGTTRITWTGYTPAINMEAWCFVGGLKGLAIYFDGLLRASSSTAVTRTQGADTIGINNGNQGESGNSNNIMFFAAFGSEWTASEVWQWTCDPYSIIRPVLRRPQGLSIPAPWVPQIRVH